jgi:hypothetical protein
MLIFCQMVCIVLLFIGWLHFEYNANNVNYLHSIKIFSHLQKYRIKIIYLLHKLLL